MRGRHDAVDVVVLGPSHHGVGGGIGVVRVEQHGLGAVHAVADRLEQSLRDLALRSGIVAQRSAAESRADGREERLAERRATEYVNHRDAPARGHHRLRQADDRLGRGRVVDTGDDVREGT